MALLGLPERNYNLQSLWITLYLSFCLWGNLTMHPHLPTATSSVLQDPRHHQHHKFSEEEIYFHFKFLLRPYLLNQLSSQVFTWEWPEKKFHVCNIVISRQLEKKKKKTICLLLLHFSTIFSSLFIFLSSHAQVNRTTPVTLEKYSWPYLRSIAWWIMVQIFVTDWV